LDSTYWPPTLVPSGQTRARSGTPSNEQSGSPGPPLLELLLAGDPLLDPLEDPPLDPLGAPLLEPEAPLLEAEGPLLEPPVPGGSSPPWLGSTRPMQPSVDRLARSTGATQRARRNENTIPISSAACVPARNPAKSDELRGSW
jgi:hypothetical protein